MTVVTLLPAGVRQAPVVGFVWQIAMLTGSVEFLVSAVTMIVPLAPTFTVATERTPAPETPCALAIPSLASVAASATMSGMGVLDAESNSVFNPEILWADPALVQLKTSATSVGSMGARGVIEKTKVCVPPAGMLTAVSRVPVTWLVVGFVV